MPMDLLKLYIHALLEGPYWVKGCAIISFTTFLATIVGVQMTVDEKPKKSGDLTIQNQEIESSEGDVEIGSGDVHVSDGETGQSGDVTIGPGSIKTGEGDITIRTGDVITDDEGEND